MIKRAARAEKSMAPKVAKRRRGEIIGSVRPRITLAMGLSGSMGNQERITLPTIRNWSRSKKSRPAVKRIPCILLFVEIQDRGYDIHVVVIHGRRNKNLLRCQDKDILSNLIDGAFQGENRTV